ncbi:tyrosine-type recombinase/integrase [Kitasatospora sp. NPDC087314]|uniref:tyrosine-type recombinase/integrase n=1 Tax=Kitasatospora sp. NPDC087314 TaxID=3364068 RepID=UPI00381B6F0E
MAWQPELVRRVDAAGNTLLATAYDLKVFFSAVPKEPADVVTADIFAFITAQKAPRRAPKVVRLDDGEAGLSARTMKRRLGSVSGLFGCLMTRDDVAIGRNPVPVGLANRRRSGNRGTPLLRTPGTLPRVLGPGEVEAVLGALNTARDRAMVLGGLRRCEVLGLRLGDLSPGERRVFISEGKGGRQRLIPISAQFFTAVGDYPDRERPPVDHDRLFVVLRGPTRGGPLSAAGLDEILEGVRKRTPAARRGLPGRPAPAPRHRAGPLRGAVRPTAARAASSRLGRGTAPTARSGPPHPQPRGEGPVDDVRMNVLTS